MNLSYEITDRFIAAHEASGLLYTPLAQPLTYRQTRRYEFDVEGDATAVEAFVRHTLLDRVSQDIHTGDEPALEGFRFILDYGMKQGALDLEKEMVAKYFRGLSAPGFVLKKLTIRQRIYVFGDGEADPKRFIRDICNPAIQNWKVIEPAHV